MCCPISPSHISPLAIPNPEDCLLGDSGPAPGQTETNDLPSPVAVIKSFK